MWVCGPLAINGGRLTTCTCGGGWTHVYLHMRFGKITQGKVQRNAITFSARSRKSMVSDFKQPFLGFAKC